MKTKVKRCFGLYGSKTPTKDIRTKEGKKKILGCGILCRNYEKCIKCYWGWYFLKKKRMKGFNPEIFIIKFMKNNNLKY